MQNRKWILWTLVVCLPITAFFSMAFGAVHISFHEMWDAVWNGSVESTSLASRIFWNLRLPRMLLGIGTGAALGVSGVLLQALFRNPIIEPGLIGTSSGAAFGASLYFVVGATLPAMLGNFTLPIAAVLGSLMATGMLLFFHRQGSGADIGILLAGIAINALFLSGVGFMSYLARDPQARSISFWNLGTLSGASWSQVGIVAVVVLPALLYSLTVAKGLNALLLGDEEASYLGIRIARFRWLVILLQVVLVAVVTSFTGVIAFVGLIIPHVLRLWGGGEHRYLLLGSMLLGPIVLLLTDLIARTILMPAEVPLGIVTSVIGAPLFLWLLKRNGKHNFS